MSQPPETLKRKSDDEPEACEETSMLETVIKELFDAKTDKERASAFRAAFAILEQEQQKD